MTDQQQTQRDAIEDDEINLMDVIARLWAGKFTIAAFVFFGSLVGVFQALNAPPTYQAEGLLQLEENGSQLALPDSIADLSGSSPRAVTEIEILKSGMVVGRAVSRHRRVDVGGCDRVHPDPLATPLSSERLREHMYGRLRCVVVRLRLRFVDDDAGH